ncbi:hypothetical protein COW36_12950 [bacterium (Candidatus Blackallbacteria) CG17_big_fil_post_rev_8_21_14_2_50_48_46]|uniref:Uncharacterized protein n=1 Tax=bacterium (Candidatus Blackallbacteria) CG17_big_fil_post_rev_8_21_14_2_50_48_46 TaxID=2014261 RepID=A0A2M7G4C5_9BACT|nr:MAG: hypothetical protein COW64_02315 [bacterium (Candidatus Blackallbacteria) CG18_big_fil_WC_8_21_14_2_50_49_26]PIW16667.1 MAG: hypothetical protein COW36_12950 [bacterium (Candidatus Blackallbacteria) CG17_big_fil_post_rev_8_21_14_2_50_48_46]PIW46173.1 MAG: hypothetical protein COW20_18205 [bacterium (Candidatus Blackallbacteria) CG13_big_fil_rev_8_21_14_2_50_49_14]
MKSSFDGRFFARVVGTRKERYLDLFLVESDKTDRHLWRIEKFYIFPEELIVSNSPTIITFSKLLSCSYEFRDGCHPDDNEVALVFYGWDSQDAKVKILFQYQIKDLLGEKQSIIENNILRGTYIWFKHIDRQYGYLHIKLLSNQDLYFDFYSGKKIDKLPKDLIITDNDD